MAKITEKSTKQEILEAYQASLKALEEKSASTFDPSAQATQIAQLETIKKVESVKVMDLQSLVNEISNKVTNLSDNLNVYNATIQAIDIKKNELKSMFDIEKSAYTLSALVNSQAELKEKFNLEMEAKKQELDQLIKTANEEMKLAREKTALDIKKMNDDAKIARQKEEETYTYDTMRKRKIETDKFNDDLAAKTKEYESKMKDLVSREANLKQLNDTIESLKVEMAEAVKVATEQATTKAKTAYTFETNYLKKDYEGKINLLENKIETLTQSLADSKSTIATLTNKLDEAYVKIESMAKATIDGAGSKDMIATLKTALSEKGTNGK